jgi:hypothetical protein
MGLDAVSANQGDPFLAQSASHLLGQRPGADQATIRFDLDRHRALDLQRHALSDRLLKPGMDDITHKEGNTMFLQDLGNSV